MLAADRQTLERPRPSATVLDLFAVPDVLRPLPGGSGGSWLAGDLVLSPGRDEAVSQWLNPTIAPLAAELDQADVRDLRIAMPIPARDGHWVVEHWGASRFEPDTTAITDHDLVVTAGRLFHGLLAVRVVEPPPGINDRRDRWSDAARVAFGAADLPDLDPGDRALAVELNAATQSLDPAELGRDQLVHADLAGNVLRDAAGVPVIIDVAPYWRPVLWAEAVSVLDLVAWFGADPAVLAGWNAGAHRQAMLRAALFRVLSDGTASRGRYQELIGPLLS